MGLCAVNGCSSQYYQKCLYDGTKRKTAKRPEEKCNLNVYNIQFLESKEKDTKSIYYDDYLLYTLPLKRKNTYRANYLCLNNSLLFSLNLNLF